MARTINIRQVKSGIKKVQALALQRRIARLKIYEEYSKNGIVLPSINQLKKAVINKRKDDLKKVIVTAPAFENKINKFKNLIPLHSGLKSIAVVAEKSKTISDAVTPKKVKIKNPIRIRMMAPQHTL